MPKFLIAYFLSIFFVSMVSRAAQHDDQPNIKDHDAGPLPADWQESAGIKTEILQIANQTIPITVLASVLSVEPLMMLRQQYQAAVAQQESAQARYRETSQNWQRTQNLHQHDIVSTRRLQEQQSQWQTDKALLNASNLQPQNLLASSRLQWGNRLTDWFLLNRDQQSENFIQNRAQLIEVILPAHVNTPADMTKIAVSPQGLHQQVISARFISSAPTVDPISQGRRYFFAIQDSQLPIGMRLQAWLADQTETSSAVRVPSSAVIWHMGQSLVFIKSETGEFKRQILTAIRPVDQDYIVSDGLQPGDEVVTTGAQTLLSRELQSLIPKEDDD